ncbi:MASE1 domain-containing protein [Flavobacterium sp.]|uniref:MASE1 domain-containing protein n=1 Tax=Flavobacterium sp. TaxID=239 RepID=UPI002CDB7022|nr:MASE1 domain-containing protein [Flavobacterium sp.]HSD08591.1 MASE1 domain-containing protein [Flavobacterium sp.]
MKSRNSLTSFYSDLPILKSTPAVVLLIALLYILLSKISSLLSINYIAISPIFPAAGLALASVLILGNRALLGIFLGAFIANIFNNINILNQEHLNLPKLVLISFFIAIGYVISSIISKYIVDRACNGRHPLHSGKNVFALLIFGSFSFSTIVALIGTSAITLGGFNSSNFWYTFKTWWLGDAIGIILITPFILSWYSKNNIKNPIKPLELIFFVLVTIFLCTIIFFKYYDLKYIIIPLLFWSAYRFGMRISTLAIILISSFAIIATAMGIGPFESDSINNSILLLDLFLSVISICSLFMSSILAERKRAYNLNKISKDRLQKNQTILESILESPKNVSIYSLNKKYQYLNFNNLHKVNMKEMNNIDIVVGMSLHECLVNKKELHDAISVLDKVFLGESITTIKRFQSNGSYWELRLNPIVNKNEKIIGATIFSTNITEKLKIEKALKKSEKKYRDIFTNSHDVIFQMDLNGNYINVSPSVEKFTEYTPEELIGQHRSVLEFDVNDEDLVSYMTNVNAGLINHERKIRTKSGLIKTVSLNAKLIYDKNGLPNHIDAIAQDITERKENEQKIALQNQKLQIQNKELEQFVYVASHDLHEPILTLKYFTDLLKDNAFDEQNPDIKQYLNFIYESSDRMQKLVKGLLDYSRIGKQVAISKENCKEIVDDAILSLSDSISKVNAKITIGELPIVNGYSVELIELFKHILTNSIEFRKKDVQLEINISAKESDHNWQFAIEDNGIGIEEHNIEKIFIIFKRLNNREEYSGIGISLAICKKIVALHGGEIWAESSFGKGTTIYFTIPKTN